MIIPFTAALAAVVFPFLFWLLWSRSEREVYNGVAEAISESAEVGKYSKGGFVAILIPGTDSLILADIPAARVAALKAGSSSTAQVSVRRKFWGEPWIQSITWADGKTEAGVKSFNGLYLAGYYLLAGLFLIPTSLVLAAAALILSGFVTGNVTRTDFSLDGNKGLLVSLSLMGILLFIGTVGVFSQLTVLTILFGLPFAFSVGQIAGMLARSHWNETSSDS